MKRPCCNADCGERRIHHERQDEPRGTQMVDVPDDYPSDKPVYCSYTCSCMDECIAVRTDHVFTSAYTKSGYKVR